MKVIALISAALQTNIRFQRYKSSARTWIYTVQCHYEKETLKHLKLMPNKIEVNYVLPDRHHFYMAKYRLTFY